MFSLYEQAKSKVENPENAAPFIDMYNLCHKDKNYTTAEFDNTTDGSMLICPIINLDMFDISNDYLAQLGPYYHETLITDLTKQVPTVNCADIDFLKMRNSTAEVLFAARVNHLISLFMHDIITALCVREGSSKFLEAVNQEKMNELIEIIYSTGGKLNCANVISGLYRAFLVPDPIAHQEPFHLMHHHNYIRMIDELSLSVSAHVFNFFYNLCYDMTICREYASAYFYNLTNVVKETFASYEPYNIIHTCIDAIFTEYQYIYAPAAYANVYPSKYADNTVCVDTNYVVGREGDHAEIIDLKTHQSEIYELTDNTETNTIDKE